MLPEAPLVLLRREAEEAVSLSGKVALVTGSTSGIGLGIARALAAAGAHVMLNGFGDKALIDKLVAEFRSQYKVKVGLQRRRHVEARRDRGDGGAGGARARRRRHPGEQRRHPARRAGRGVPGREVGRGHRDQPLGRLPRHPRRAAAHEGAQLGTHHQHRLDPRPGGVGAEGGLRRGEARHPRPDEGRRARDRDHRHHLQRDLPRLGADAARAEADRRPSLPGKSWLPMPQR